MFDPSGNPSSYTSTFSTTITNATDDATTYYYARCYYICSSDTSRTQERAGGSFSVEPPCPTFYGLSKATVKPTKGYSPEGWISVDYTTNAVELEATCEVQGKYALVSKTSWPAQIVPCPADGRTTGESFMGTPGLSLPGLFPCTSAAYDPKVPTITPQSISYDETRQIYIATYRFIVTPAVLYLTQLSGQSSSGTSVGSFRAFSCFYNDQNIRINQRASASVDVYTTLPETVDLPASGVGDPYITDFMRRSFYYNGTHGAWSDLLNNTALTKEVDPFSIRMLIRYVPDPRLKASYIRSFKFIKRNSPSTEVYITLVQDPITKAWTMLVQLDGKRVNAGEFSLARGKVKVRVTAPVDGVNGNVRITTNYLVFDATQPWWRKNFRHHDYFNFGIKVLRRPSPGGVGGLLGPSLREALRGTKKAGDGVEAIQAGGAIVVP